MIWLKLLRNVRPQGFLRLASVLMVACNGALIIRVGYVEGLTGAVKFWYNSAEAKERKMANINIRPISDLRNDYASVEADVQKGPVFLTKNGYGTLVTMTIEEYERLTDPLERFMDETDEYCRAHSERVDGEEMFTRIRKRRHAIRQVPA